MRFSLSARERMNVILMALTREGEGEREKKEEKRTFDWGESEERTLVPLIIH